MAEEYSVLVKAELDQSSISNLKSSLQSELTNLSNNTFRVRVDIDTTNVQRQIDNIRTQLQNLSNIRINLMQGNGGGGGGGGNNNLNQIANQYQRIINLQNQINQKRISLAKIDGLSGTSNQVDALNRQIAALQGQLNQMQTTFNMTAPQEQINRLSLALQRMEVDTGRSIDLVRSKIQDTANAISEAVNKTNGNQFESQITNIENKLQKLNSASNETRTSVENLKTAYDELRSATENYNQNATTNNANQLIQANERYIKSLKDTKTQLDINKNAEEKNLSLDKDVFSSQIDAWSTKNSAALKVFGTQIDDIKRRLKSADDTELGNLKKEFQIIKNQAQEAGLTVQSFGDRFKQSFSRLTSYISGMTIITKGIQAVKGMYNEVKNVDTALTELYRVTDLSTSQYDSLYSRMTQSAREYGSELDKLINSTASWVRLGFDADVAVDLSEITAMYQHVTDLDEATAVKNLVTAYKGFQDTLLTQFNGNEAEAIERVADIYDKLGNEFAESAADVGDGLRHSASVLQQGGASIEEAASMFTGIQEVLQDSSTSGNTLKILTLRIRGMKGELEALGEEVDENVDSISKIQTQILNLTHGKVNIFDENQNFRDIYDIMKDIASVYDDLSDPDRASLLEIIAGKNRAVGVQALINNWTQVEAATKAAYESAGTAQAEQAIWMDSLEGHLSRLSTAWQVFANDFLDSSFLKTGIDALTSILNILDKVVDTLGVLPTLGIGAGITAFIKNFD